MFVALVVFVGTARSAPSGLFTFTTIDCPSTTFSAAYGINGSGQVVGSCKIAGVTHGFLMTGGAFSILDFPGSVGTEALGINGSAQIVGDYTEAGAQAGVTHGFRLSGGTFTTIDPPTSASTQAYGINSSGEVVGEYIGPQPMVGGPPLLNGFLLSNNAFTLFDFPGALFTEAFGVNSSGQIVGEYQNPNQAQQGFLLSNGKYTTLDYPGATATLAYGINDSGQVVGVYLSSNGYHGFLLSGSQFSSIDFPGATRTEAFGINNSGQVVGYYVIADGVHGFLATPQPPPSISANGVVNGASFVPGVVPSSWTTIEGSSLAAQTGDWSNAIVNGRLPTTLNGVSVTIGGKPAYVYYVSPSQLNVLAPQDLPAGPVTVTVTTPGGGFTSFTTTASQYGPAFFPWPSSQVVATRQDYSFAAKQGTFAGTPTVAAKPGEVIILWGTGFGPTIPVAPDGVAVPSDRAYSTATQPAITINNTSATVYGAALTPGAVGLYQIAIQVPSSLADGDWPIQASIGGAASPLGIVLSVHH
jgi:uncharacterized protein (TIGR03437 family)